MIECKIIVQKNREGDKSWQLGEIEKDMCSCSNPIRRSRSAFGNRMSNATTRIYGGFCLVYFDSALFTDRKKETNNLEAPISSRFRGVAGGMALSRLW